MCHHRYKDCADFKLGDTIDSEQGDRQISCGRCRLDLGLPVIDSEPFARPPDRFWGDSNNDVRAGTPWATWDNGERHVSFWPTASDGLSVVLWASDRSRRLAHTPEHIVFAWHWLNSNCGLEE
jgi:hypothetical protein